MVLFNDPCNELSILRIILFIKTLLNIVFTIVPIIVILILSFDMFKNVASSNNDDQKKKINIFIKRCIYTFIVFLIPTIISFITNLIDDSGVGDGLISINQLMFSYYL